MPHLSPPANYPQIPDDLCHQCLEIFERDFTLTPSPQNLVYVNSQNPLGCRLCALFLDKFDSSPDAMSPLELGYVLRCRDGYFMGVFDIEFFVMQEASAEGRRIRLCFQEELRTESSMPHPVPYDLTISTTTGSGQSFARARGWVRECMDIHVECKLAVPSSNFMPTRLVEIASGRLLNIRLRKGSEIAPEAPYAALSHCWGSNMPYKLTQARLSSCIIQDSAEDWGKESAQMGSIYNHSLLNIAATGFSNGENGLFSRRDPALLLPIKVTLQQDIHTVRKNNHRQMDMKRGNYLLIDVNTWKDAVDESPLCNRGWVAQERTLSIRTLHLGHRQLFWECLCKSRSEVFPEGFVQGTLAKHPKRFLQSRASEQASRMEKAEKFRQSHKDAKIRYRERLERERMGKDKYSLFPTSFFKPKGYTMSDWMAMWTPQDLEGCDLSVFDDISNKLVAISGLASLISKDMKCQYLAGMWRKDLEHQLLWKVRVTRPEAAFGNTRGPSWTWASVDGSVKTPWMESGCVGLHEHSPLRWIMTDEISSHPEKLTWISKVNQAQVTPLGSREFGQVKSGCLTITGRLGVFRIDKSKTMTNPPVNGKGKLVSKKTWIAASWDTLETEAVFGPSGRTELWRYTEYGTQGNSKTKAKANQLNVFCLPTRIMNADPVNIDYEAPMLTGLLLLPGGKNGYYRRIGQYEVSEHWEDGSVAAFTNKTTLLDSSLYISKDKKGNFKIVIV
ncbi:uncharacterized protein BCR38DRAFT_501249 [Pseudomassariella vexata]|uniref:Heterokaryon incompatibility domain-containing protein n=1 Tax=Pseudomassariella vexata TaxID=1141098 RepID=A0A1Y2DEM1_9PEZI|nr:uncharacterized protein BCR38DRAFT_501249 [Pseudomassariella vexata]ORY57732.1 hypothetical protein BCR38DRAFT_501249 [Pseudomassariella vexata]